MFVFEKKIFDFSLFSSLVVGMVEGTVGTTTTSTTRTLCNVLYGLQLATAKWWYSTVECTCSLCRIWSSSKEQFLSILYPGTWYSTLS